MFEDIQTSGSWETVAPIQKGWSQDRKFFIQTRDGRRLLLRLSDGAQYPAKKKEFEIITKYAGLGFPMSAPVGFGVCGGGKNVYLLLTWVDGLDLEQVLPTLPETEQYRLGRSAGEILKKIHSIPLEAGDLPADTRKAKKLLQLSRYEASSVRVPGDAAVIRYVRENIDEIGKRKPVYQHGDFHPGNLIYTESGSIGVIDFNRWAAGDPYEEFYKLESFGVECSIPYCAGQIDAYFDGSVPEDFWRALAVYVAHASLHSIKWAEKFGQKDVDGMNARCRRALDDYDGFRRIIPRWYPGEGRTEAR